MKIQSIKSVNTVVPERHWMKGEIIEVTTKVGTQLLTNPNFREIKIQEVKLSRTYHSRIRRKRK